MASAILYRKSKIQLASEQKTLSGEKPFGNLLPNDQVLPIGYKSLVVLNENNDSIKNYGLGGSRGTWGFNNTAHIWTPEGPNFSANSSCLISSSAGTNTPLSLFLRWRDDLRGTAPSFKYLYYCLAAAEFSVFKFDSSTWRLNNTIDFAENEVKLSDGKWHSVLVSTQGTGNLHTLYIDGKYIAEDAENTAADFLSVGGRDDTVARYSGGTVGCTAYWDRALTPQEAKELTSANFDLIIPARWTPVIIGAPGQSITGDLASQETGADSAALTGDVLVSGDLAAQETGSDTAALTGDVLVSGDLAAQETGSDAAALAGNVLVAGDLAAQESGQDILAFSGEAEPAITGTLAAQETGSDSAVIAGAVIISGDVAAQEIGADVSLLTGTITVAGDLAAQESGSDTLLFYSITPQQPLRSRGSRGLQKPANRPIQQ